MADFTWSWTEAVPPGTMTIDCNEAATVSGTTAWPPGMVFETPELPEMPVTGLRLLLDLYRLLQRTATVDDETGCVLITQTEWLRAEEIMTRITAHEEEIRAWLP
jgi:hypothetical protein